LGYRHQLRWAWYAAFARVQHGPSGDLRRFAHALHALDDELPGGVVIEVDVPFGDERDAGLARRRGDQLPAEEKNELLAELTERLNDGPGVPFVLRAHHVQRAVRLHVLNRDPLGGGERPERADLIHNVVLQVLRGDRHGAPAEADEIGKRD